LWLPGTLAIFGPTGTAAFHDSGWCQAAGRASHVARKLTAYAPALLWAALIALMAGASELPATPGVPYFDKLAHFAVYAVLGLLLGRGWVVAGRRPAWPWLLLFALLLGVTDELRQAQIPERSAELADWVADALGAATGFLIAVRIARRRHGTQKS
jgi:VanZ family protein